MKHAEVIRRSRGWSRPYRVSRGAGFRLRDFEGHFQVDRKTAWEYVQKLLQAGLLVHNQGHSSAVRYQVAPRFLEPAWDHGIAWTRNRWGVAVPMQR